MVANQLVFVSFDIALAEAYSLAMAAGLKPCDSETTTYAFVVGDFPPGRIDLLRMTEIAPPLRSAGSPLFPRAAPIIAAMHAGAHLPPVEVERLPEPRGPHLYRVRDGFHRYYFSLALGHIALPAVVWPFFEGA